MFACRSLLGLVYWGRLGTLQKCRPAIVAFPCIKSSSRGRDSHLSVIALIKYPSLMPLYIYSVSLETHKASFSDLCDETSLHYLPGTFWWNKRPIEQSFEMNKYGKRGEEKSRQCSGTKSFIHMDVVHALSSFPQWHLANHNQCHNRVINIDIIHQPCSDVPPFTCILRM